MTQQEGRPSVPHGLEVPTQTAFLHQLAQSRAGELLPNFSPTAQDGITNFSYHLLERAQRDPNVGFSVYARQTARGSAGLTVVVNDPAGVERIDRAAKDFFNPEPQKTGFKSWISNRFKKKEEEVEERVSVSNPDLWVRTMTRDQYNVYARKAGNVFAKDVSIVVYEPDQQVQQVRRMRFAPARLGLGVATLLTMAVGSVHAENPPRPGRDYVRPPRPPYSAPNPNFPAPVAIVPPSVGEILPAPSNLTAQEPPKQSDPPAEPIGKVKQEVIEKHLEDLTKIAEIRQQLDVIAQAVPAPIEANPEAILATMQKSEQVETSKAPVIVQEKESVRSAAPETLTIEPDSNIWNSVKGKLRLYLQAEPTNEEIAKIATEVCLKNGIESDGLGVVEGYLLDTAIPAGMQLSMPDEILTSIAQVQAARGGRA